MCKYKVGKCKPLESIYACNEDIDDKYKISDERYPDFSNFIDAKKASVFELADTADTYFMQGVPFTTKRSCAMPIIDNTSITRCKIYEWRDKWLDENENLDSVLKTTISNLGTLKEALEFTDNIFVKYENDKIKVSFIEQITTMAPKHQVDITLDKDVVWFFIQAPGGGGGEISITSINNYCGGAGGGSGAAAWLGINMKQLANASVYGDKNSFIAIEKSSLFQSWRNPVHSGQDGGDIVVNLYSSDGQKINTLITIHGGKTGTSRTPSQDEILEGGKGGTVETHMLRYYPDIAKCVMIQAIDGKNGGRGIGCKLGSNAYGAAGNSYLNTDNIAPCFLLKNKAKMLSDKVTYEINNGTKITGIYGSGLSAKKQAGGGGGSIAGMGQAVNADGTEYSKGLFGDGGCGDYRNWHTGRIDKNYDAGGPGVIFMLADTND